MLDGSGQTRTHTVFVFRVEYEIDLEVRGGVLDLFSLMPSDENGFAKRAVCNALRDASDEGYSFEGKEQLISLSHSAGVAGR